MDKEIENWLAIVRIAHRCGFPNEARKALEHAFKRAHQISNPPVRFNTVKEYAQHKAEEGKRYTFDETLSMMIKSINGEKP